MAFVPIKSAWSDEYVRLSSVCDRHCFVRIGFCDSGKRVSKTREEPRRTRDACETSREEPAETSSWEALIEMVTVGFQSSQESECGMSIVVMVKAVEQVRLTAGFPRCGDISLTKEY